MTQTESIGEVVNHRRHPLADAAYRRRCRRALTERGALVLHEFLTPPALDKIKREGDAKKYLAYFTAHHHNIFLADADANFARDHPRNREVASSKGCITDECIAGDSPLRALYDAPAFRDFLCAVLGERALYDYADSLSSINLHYAERGQELGWHFDNASFAVTLMIQPALQGGVFEFVGDARGGGDDATYARCEKILNGEVEAETLSMRPGTLVLFCGRRSLHRVSPVKGNRTRMLAALAYNTEPGVALSEAARLTFYGRLGDDPA